MNFSSIGKNIRKYRLAKRMTQDELAEKTGLSVTYIGMLERGEKLPAIDTFIDILNALEVSADMILNEVVATGYKLLLLMNWNCCQKKTGQEYMTL